MTKSPFKFLDSYTREDREIFFGRDREIEEMYQKVFESKMLLVYGISGTGKTSLINCGLANKFEDSDWLPVNVRRGRSVVESLWRELGKVALSKIQSAVDSRQSAKKYLAGDQIVKAIKSIYLDHFKPIYLIFDQFEELFIFGDREERDQFIQIVKAVVDSDVQCRFIFSIREEYLAGVTEFETLIPDFLTNRMRIEKMTSKNAIQVIEGPCKVHNIEVEEGFSETVLGKLSPESTEVELTYLQVFLDKVFRLATGKNKEKPGFTNELLEQVGDVSDLLGSFLEEQISQLDNPDTGLTILKSFVSIKGTKRQVTLEDVSDFATTLGKKISEEELKSLIIRFVNLRILRDKDESGRYELRHDGLATKIYEKITLVEKELLEVRQFIDNAYANYEKRNVCLSVEDLKYIAPYEDKLFLNQKLEKFINDSKREAQKEKRRKRNVAVIAVVSLIIILSGFTIWAIIEKSKATRALVEKEIAEKKLDEAAKDFVMSAENMNILYRGIENPLSFAIPGMSKGSIFFNADLPMSLSTVNKRIIVIPESTGIANISLYRILEKDTLKLGTRSFNVKNLPPPIPTLNGKSSGFILRDSLIKAEGINAIIKDFNYNYEFQVISYELSFEVGNNRIIVVIPDNNISEDVRNQFEHISHNSNIYFRNIRVLGPDEIMRNLGTLSLTVVRWFNYENTLVFYSLVEQAVEDEDWDTLMKMGIENLRKYYWDHPDVLNNVAYKFYFNFFNDTLCVVGEGHPVFKDIQNALEWSGRAIELENNNPDYLNTYATLLFSLGRLDEAEANMRKVIEILKELGEPTRDKEFFLEKILISKKYLKNDN